MPNRKLEFFEGSTRYDGDFDVEELLDFQMTLGELSDNVAKLLEKFGRDATVRIDSGHNNASVIVNTEYTLYSLEEIAKRRAKPRKPRG